MLQVVEGDGEASLSMDMVRQRFANMDELEGHSLYVTVTVLTESGTQGGRVGTAGTCWATSCVCLS